MSRLRDRFYWWAGIAGVALAFCLQVLAGCVMDPEPSVPASALGEAPQSAFTAAQVAVIQDACVDCHADASVGGIDFDPISDFDFARLDDLDREMAFGTAPVQEPFSRGEREILLGGRRSVELTPQSVQWSIEEQLTGVSAQYASGPGAPFFGFRIQDGYRHGFDGPSEFTIVQRGGQSWLSLDSSLGPGNQQPVNYAFPTGVPFHGELLEANVIGQVDLSEGGRWAGIVVSYGIDIDAGKMGRRYVRLQFDRDQVGFRSAPTNQEAHPWYQDPEQVLSGSIEMHPGYLHELVTFELRVRQLSGRVRYELDATWPGGGATLACEATRDAGEPFSIGVFGYSASPAVFYRISVESVTTTGDDSPTDVPY